ncbi:MAG: hypothetical protein ACRD4T_05930, partial [Candidatus Acidiferrales bacterium]
MTLIALLHFILAFEWFFLFALACWELIRDLTKTRLGGVAFDVLLLGWFLLGASLFLLAGSGLWHLRRWAIAFVATLATLITAGLLADFYRWTNSLGRDFITEWDIFVLSFHMAVLGPYHLILWPMWKGIGYFFPDTPFFVEVVAGILPRRFGIRKHCTLHAERAGEAG